MELSVGETVELKWLVSSDATGYDIYLNGRVFDKNIRPVEKGGVLTYKLKKSDFGEGKNTWKIRALGDLNQIKDAANNAQGNFVFTKQVLLPTSFKLISPLSGATVENSLILTWQEVKKFPLVQVLINGKVFADNQTVVARGWSLYLQSRFIHSKSGQKLLVN